MRFLTLISLFASVSCTLLIDSGPPSPKIPTGTWISDAQSAALLLDQHCYCIIKSIELILDTSNIDSNYNSTYISLCEDLNELNCTPVEEFQLPQTKRLAVQWEPTQSAPKLDKDLWLIIKGNGQEFSNGFTWLDAARFNATTAFYTPEGGWVVDGVRNDASTIKVTVESISNDNSDPLNVQ